MHTFAIDMGRQHPFVLFDPSYLSTCIALADLEDLVLDGTLQPWFTEEKLFVEQFCNYLVFLEGSDDKKSSKGIEAKEQGTEPSEEIQGSSGEA